MDRKYHSLGNTPGGSVHASPRRTIAKFGLIKPSRSKPEASSGGTVTRVQATNTASTFKCTKPENKVLNCIAIANGDSTAPSNVSSASSHAIIYRPRHINRNRTLKSMKLSELNDDACRKQVSNHGVMLMKRPIFAGSQPLIRNGTASLTSASTRPTPGTANVTPHRLLRSRANTPNNATRCSLDTLQYTPRSTIRPQHLPRSSLAASSTASSVHNSHTSLHLLRGTGGGTRSSSSSMTGGYDSDESATSLRLERSVQSGMIQDAMALKTMLFRLKRVLQENMDEDILLKSETHNPFDPASLSLMTLQNLYNNSISVPVTSSGTAAITNGHVFGNTCLNNNGTIHNNSTLTSTPDQQQQQIHLCSIVEEQRLELTDLRRQVLYQQGQLEDRDKEVQRLREDMARLMRAYENGDCSTGVGFEENGGVVVDKSNAATQTDRIRPISCGPAILDGTATGNGSLVSSTEVSSSTPNNSMTSRSGSRPHLPVTPRNSHHHICCNNDNTPISRSSSRPPLRHGSSGLSAPLCASSSPAVITPAMPVVASSIPRRSSSRSRT